eukprot:TRINITY_DN13089_c0_g1_i1.p1 TRINITY_DN13089_c0_g1~~TRINITY_DN13089_c0_g1_i1.p1  ORF type:complete len:234 (-),score=50.73 TRINITY_DN13089_c0_g1_i1:90-791(-)
MSFNYVHIVVSGLIGGLFGVFEAEIIAFSLLEISVNKVFPYIFGVGFVLLSIALAWRIWVSVENTKARAVLLFFSALVFVSGVACFFLNENVFKTFPAAGKVPLYALLGISFAFTVTYCFSEVVALNPWSEAACCASSCPISENNPLFGSQEQVLGLFSVSLLMGASFGLLFGLIDVEDGDISKNLLTNTIYGIPLGFVVGASFAAGNEWYRQRKVVVVPTVNAMPQDTDALL